MSQNRQISVTYTLQESQIAKLRELTERYNSLMGGDVPEEEVFSFIMRTGSVFAIDRAMKQYDHSLLALEELGLCGGVV